MLKTLILNNLFQPVVRLVRPMCKIKKFSFHLRRACFRKIQSLGLTKMHCNAWTENEKKKLLKKFFWAAISVANRNRWLCYRRNNVCLARRMYYYSWFYKLRVYEPYKILILMFPPGIGAEFSAFTSRITNACKRSHSIFNGMFYHSHCNIYRFLEALNAEQIGK